METSTMEEIYQQIANSLVNIIPEEWKEIYLYAEFRDGYKKVFSIITLKLIVNRSIVLI